MYKRILFIFLSTVMFTGQESAMAKENHNPFKDSIQLQAAKEVGLIKEINLQDRTIQIDKKKYALADKTQVISHDNHLLSEENLKEGQKIEYWVSDKPEHDDNQQLPDKTIYRIRIISKDHQEDLPS